MKLEKSYEWGIEKYELFIDLQKAFDRVNRTHLWRILQENYCNIIDKIIVAKNDSNANQNKIATLICTKRSLFKISSLFVS